MGKLQELQSDIEKIELVKKETQSRIDKAVVNLNKDIKKIKTQQDKEVTKLRKAIKRKFKNIDIDLTCEAHKLRIQVGEQEYLSHSYKESKFNHITRELYKELIEMYNDVYGEVEVAIKITWATTSLIQQMSNLTYEPYRYSEDYIK